MWQEWNPYVDSYAWYGNFTRGNMTTACDACSQSVFAFTSISLNVCTHFVFRDSECLSK